MKTNYNPIADRRNINTADILPKHDVVFGSPVHDPTYGLPIGDGDTGCLLWVTEDSLKVHINKTDLWDDSTSENTDYCSSEDENLTSLRHGAVLTVQFAAPCFEMLYQKAYEARLSLADATATIRSETAFSELKIKAFACSYLKTTVIRCDAHTTEAMPAEINLERWGSRNCWRWYSQMKHAPEAGLQGTLTEAADNRVFITQQLRNTAFCAGIAYISDSKAKTVLHHSRKGGISVPSAKSIGFTLYIHISTGKTAEEAKELCKKYLENAVQINETYMYEYHTTEWENFWNKSFISVPHDFTENLWYLNLYYANSECRGAYPPLFCNGVWGFYHDFVPWNYYFHYNMQLHHFPLHAAGHPQLTDNYNRFRKERLPQAQAYCMKNKQVEGAFYHDVSDRNGLGAQYDSLNCTPGAQIAMEMYRHSRYTGDEAFFENTALPVMRETARFYINTLKKGGDGLYHIYGTSAYEGTPPFDDTITDLAMIRSLFSALARKTQGAEAEQYTEILTRLPDYKLLPLEEDETDGKILTRGFCSGTPAEEGGQILSVGKKHGSDEWTRKNYGNPERVYYGFPDTELSPLYPAGVTGLADRGTPLFRALLNQMRLHPKSKECMGWCLAPVYLARLGMAEEMAVHIEDIIDTWIIYPQGFGTYGPANTSDHCERWKMNDVRDTDSGETKKVTAWNFRHFDYETLPVIATAVNESLLQSYDGVLRICPAIKKGDKVSFRLYAEGGFIVQVETDGSGYILSIEKTREEACTVSLPDYFGEPYVYTIRGGEAVPASAENEQRPHEKVLKLNFGQDSRMLLCSDPIETYEFAEAEPVQKNNGIKRCGKAKLGEVGVF